VYPTFTRESLSLGFVVYCHTRNLGEPVQIPIPRSFFVAPLSLNAGAPRRREAERQDLSPLNGPLWPQGTLIRVPYRQVPRPRATSGAARGLARPRCLSSSAIGGAEPEGSIGDPYGKATIDNAPDAETAINSSDR
jgi:hypothetical protein